MRPSAISNYMTAVKINILLSLFFTTLPLCAQKDWSLKGRIEAMPVLMYSNKTIQDITKSQKNPITYGEINNRLDFQWYPTSTWTFHLGIRNNLNGGDLLHTFNTKTNKSYNKFLSEDNGYLNLAHRWINNNDYTFYSTIDRLQLTNVCGNLTTTLGRQRINWGISEVWQPNDIFNSYNYFDFNYPEHAGSDAVRLQYYTGATSSIDIAYKINRQNQSTYALRYKSMIDSYDWQVLAGIMNQQYTTLGLGWSGNLADAGFTGEITYFHPLHSDEGQETLLASISSNYLFTNQFLISASVLFNTAGTTHSAKNNRLMYQNNITALDYTRSVMECMARFSYPVTPLFTVSCATIINPFDCSNYISPSMEYSTSNNTSLMLLGQFFSGKKDSEYGNYGQGIYLRFTWNFFM